MQLYLQNAGKKMVRPTAFLQPQNSSQICRIWYAIQNL